MPIDTAFKRRSAATARRMPWMRRFGVAPDGIINQGDRQAKAWVYVGIAAAEPVPFIHGTILVDGVTTDLDAPLVAGLSTNEALIVEDLYSQSFIGVTLRSDT